METVTSIQLLRQFVEAPGARALLKGLSSYCNKDQKSRLEVALELYLGLRDDACLKCRLAEKSVSALLKVGGNAFGATEEAMKSKFKDPYWRRGLMSVIKGLALFGFTKPFVPGAPFQVVWNITYNCNLRCRHCYADAGGSNYYEMGTEEAKSCIDKLAKWGVVILAFSGGEPLIRRDILDLVKHSNGHGIYTAIATNGVLLTKERCRELRSAGVEYLQISLDGATPETHDTFRGVPGMFERTVQGIKNAVAEGFFVNVATTVTHYNLKEVPQIIDLCESLGVKWFMMYNFIPTGRGRFIISNDLSPQEREELLKFLWEKLKNSKVSVLSTAPQFARVALQTEGVGCSKVPTHFLNSDLPDKLKSLSDFIGGCGAGRFYIAMNPNGDITPCVYFPMVVGNIFKDDLEALWTDLREFKELRMRDTLKEHCGVCEYRYVCGGCRARAYCYSGDYNSPDPGCVLNKEFYNGLLNKYQLAYSNKNLESLKEKVY
ncbi:MAG: radical SAM protein [Candidatus Methanomethylicaceae archaeon]|nr:radical SAM protein [Candidatus Verstraetearchaeota archaeon]